MNLDQLPTLEQTIPPMLELANAVRREITRQVPATAPWRWVDEFSSSPCEDGGTSLYFPGLYSAHEFSEDEWSAVLPEVTRLAADAGLTGGSEGPMNKPGNHDVNFLSDDGRRLRFGARYSILVRPYVGCRHPGAGLLVDGRIPMPPAPTP